MYIVILAMIFLVCTAIKSWRRKLGTLILAGIPYLIVGVVIPTFVLPTLHIAPGESNEILAVPMQQVANVAHNHKDDLSASEITDIEQIYHMDINQLQQAYCWYKADPIKGQQLSSEDEHKLIRTWAEQLIKHPGDMLAAWEASLQHGSHSMSPSEMTETLVCYFQSVIPAITIKASNATSLGLITLKQVMQSRRSTWIRY